MKIENPLPTVAVGAGVGILAFATIKVAEAFSIFTAATATAAAVIAMPFAFWGAMIGLAGWGMKALFKGTASAQPAK